VTCSIAESRDSLDARGDEHVALSRANGVRGHANGLQGRRAVAIHGDSGHVVEPGENGGYAGDIETGLTGWLTAPDNEIFDAMGVKRGHLVQSGAHDEGREVVRAKIHQ
jgi:hypothetical protein